MTQSRPRAPHFWFCVDDLLYHFRRRQAVTGIQRVSLEVIREAIHYEPRRVGLVRTAWIFQRFEIIRTLPAPLEEALDWPTSSRHGPLCLQSGDRIIELGWGWPHWAFQRAAGKATRQGIRFATLIHDILPITHPFFFHRAHEKKFAHGLQRFAAHCDLFLVSSNAVKSALIGHLQGLGFPTKSVEKLGFGAGFHFENDAQLSPPWADPYVLAVGTLEIRKNHLLLIKIWERLIGVHGFDAVPMLVFVGRKGWKTDELLKRLMETRNLGGKVLWLEHANDALLALAYRHCMFTAYASLAEGWGLPVSESLRFGKLCVCSNRGALPETGGAFADYFDPENLDEAYLAVERATFDRNYLARRNSEIAKNYPSPTWSDTATQLIRILAGPS